LLHLVVGGLVGRIVVDVGVVAPLAELGGRCRRVVLGVQHGRGVLVALGAQGGLARVQELLVRADAVRQRALDGLLVGGRELGRGGRSHSRWRGNDGRGYGGRGRRRCRRRGLGAWRRSD